jgi:voltage-gated potassium channel
MKMNKISIGFLYEVVLAGLVIFSLIVEIEQQEALDWFIWVLFVIDYTIRFWRSEEKWNFVKSNPLDLIAIIPLDQFFKAARLIRVIRLIVLLKRRKPLMDDFFKNYNIDKLFVFVIAIMFLAAVPMKWLETSFETYGDAFWWVIVTTTTVGYGDLYPETTVGRIIAAFLMIVGVGIIGVITGTVASFLTNRKNIPLEEPDEITYIKNKINKFPDLSNDDYDLMIAHLEQLKKSKKPPL